VVKRDKVRNALLELIRLTATNLPEDVEKAIRLAWKKEEAGSPASFALQTILENVEIARKEQVPICQDTGIPHFFVTLPCDEAIWPFMDDIRTATKRATQLSYLRPNVVDALREVNTGDNVGGDSIPVISFNYHDAPHIVIDLLLKGGGSENVGRQYTLPDSRLNASRDLEGVRRCVLDAVFKAQGFGCAPGIVGVAVGGDRAQGYHEAKKALLRRVGELHPDKEVARWEKKIRKEANRLLIGPMGFGGKTTVLDVHLTFLYRHPASYFVTVAYMCWACRRRRLVLEREKISFF